MDEPGQGPYSPKTMALDEAELEALQELASLRLSSDEKPRVLANLRRILAYMEQLQAIDTSHVDPKLQPALGCEELRPDEPQECLTPEEALDQAPRARSDHFEIPPVMGERQDS